MRGCYGAAQGPAVWALRAQTDKVEYSREMRRVLESTHNLEIREVRPLTGPAKLAQRWRLQPFL